MASSRGQAQQRHNVVVAVEAASYGSWTPISWKWEMELAGRKSRCSEGYEPHTPEDDSVTAMRASPLPPKPLPSANLPLCCSCVRLSLSRSITPPRVLHTAHRRRTRLACSPS